MQGFKEDGSENDQALKEFLQTDTDCKLNLENLVTCGHEILFFGHIM